MDDEMMAIMGLSGFGKTTKKKVVGASAFERTKRVAEPTVPGPSTKTEENTVDANEPVYDPSAPELNAPPPPPARTAEEDPDSSDADADEPAFSSSDFPTTHELILKDHTKVISALTLDPSGARVLSGSHDYDVKLWDFGGMSSSAKPFKTWEPAGSYYVHDLKYSNAGDVFLCISGTSQAKLYDRDGEEKAEFIKGDPYIRDMKNTAGHVADLYSCAWHPKDPKTFITSSADSTIRIWDIENRRKQKTVIVVKSKERGTRTKVTACAYSPDGKVIAGACLDGALHLWNTSSNFVRPNSTIEGAHVKNTETGSVVFSIDGRQLVTRGGTDDNTVKLWDVRQFKKPVKAYKDLATLYPQTNAIFSPDEKYIVTGTASTSRGGHGKLVFIQREDFEVVETVDMASTIVRVVWHSKINQIVTGMANGQISVLYSPLTSTNGAKLLANKAPPRKAAIEDMSAALLAPTILTPHALPMYRDGDAPREALLKYADRAEEDPQWTGAWKINQPNPVFQEAEESEKEED